MNRVPCEQIRNGADAVINTGSPDRSLLLCIQHCIDPVWISTPLPLLSPCAFFTPYKSKIYALKQTHSSVVDAYKRDNLVEIDGSYNSHLSLYGRGKVRGMTEKEVEQVMRCKTSGDEQEKRERDKSVEVRSKETNTRKARWEQGEGEWREWGKEAGSKGDARTTSYLTLVRLFSGV